MSHREQHYAGIHYHNVTDVGFSWKDHPPRPFNSYWAGAPSRTPVKNCPDCNKRMFIYGHYPFEKRLREIWACHDCWELYMFIE